MNKGTMGTDLDGDEVARLAHPKFVRALMFSVAWMRSF